MTAVNWNQVLVEAGIDGLRDFCNGNMTRREFESLGTTTRCVVRSLGTDETRSRARRVLKLRRIKV